MHVLSLVGVMVVLQSCQRSPRPATQLPKPASLDSLQFSAEAADEWTEIFYRKSGWFGADGIFSIPLDGTDDHSGPEERLLIFSDTYIGTVEDNAPLPGNTMVNNSIAYVSDLGNPASIEFHYNSEKDKSLSYFIPKNQPADRKQHFWLGDGFVHPNLNNRLFLFAYHVEITGENVFDFIEPDVSLLVIEDASKPPFENYQQLSTPLHIDHATLGEGNFGAGILVNTEWAEAYHPDGFIYTYGCIGPEKSLVVARVSGDAFSDFSKWTYWDGTDWSTEIDSLQPISNAVSNELSVTPLRDGRYLLTFQVMGLSEKVGIRLGSSPIGPFGDIIEVYTTPEMEEGIWTYNAKAHPALSKRGEMLISYNTITLDFWNDIQKDAHIYRPRFIRLTSDVFD